MFMHVGGAAFALFFVGLNSAFGESGMRLPGSPTCKDSDALNGSDVTDWKDYVDTQVPPLAQLQRANASLGAPLAALQSQEQRSHYITAAYTKLCSDRVLGGGQCERPPEASFLWTCAAAYGSYNAGTYMREGISEYRLQTGKGSNALVRFLARSSIVPAVRTLGEANALIFETVGWQHFAAAKCGPAFAAALVRRSSLVDKDRYETFWRTSPGGGPLDGSAVPRETAQFLGQEQRLIQPILDRERTLLGLISRQSMILSGVPGSPSFDRYARETLGVPKGRVTFADFNQRFLWERDSLVPNILKRVLAPRCEGAGSLRVLASLVGDRQRDVSQRQDGLARFPRISAEALAGAPHALRESTLAQSTDH